VHNDAAYVSHDLYGVMRTATGWGPQGYARRYSDVENFAGLNFAPALEAARASGYLGGEIVTLTDYALVLAPRSEIVTLKLAPATSHVLAGQAFAVEMEVLAGAQPVDAINAYLDFDPAVLQVVDAAGNPATQITPGTGLANVTTNSADNAAGRINFVASGGPVDGRFTAAVARFKALTPALTSPLTWSSMAPRQSAVRLAGVSVLGSLQGGAAAVGPSALLAGHAMMQGRPAPPDPTWQAPLLLTLSRPGERGPAYVFGAAGNANGAFAMPGVAIPDDYRIRLKGLHTLRNLLPTVLTAGVNTVNMETLLEGDAYNDNRVDLRDVSLLAAAYGKSRGQAGFDPRADFNEDGAVNQDDFNLLRANLGRRGDVLVAASAASAQAAGAQAADDVLAAIGLEPSTPAGPVSLSLLPARTSAGIGAVIVLDVVAEAGDQAVDAAQLHLDFDPAALQIVDAAGAPATQIEPGATLPTVLINHVDATRGWADFLASSLGAPATGQFTVARLRVKLLSPGAAWVRFSFSDWRSTDVVYQSQSVLGEISAAEIAARGAHVRYLPVMIK